MADSTSQRWHDQIIAHGARLVGVENGLARSIVGIWRQSLPRALATVASWPGRATNRTAEAALDAIMGVVQQSALDMGSVLGNDLLDQANAEQRIVGNIIWRGVPQSIWDAVGGMHRIDEVIIKPDFHRPISDAKAFGLLNSDINGINWTERITDMSADVRKAVRRELAAGVAAGEGVDKIQRRIRKVWDIPLRRAETIARTEVHNVSTRVMYDTYNANKDVIRGVEYLSTLDRRTCQICIADDGRKFYYNRLPSVESRPFIPQHPRCRCVYVPFTRGSRDFYGVSKKDKAVFAGPVTKPSDYGTWLKGQTVATVTEILGPVKTRIFLTGKLKLRNFVNDGKVRTIPAIEKSADRMAAEGAEL